MRLDRQLMIQLEQLIQEKISLKESMRSLEKAIEESEATTRALKNMAGRKQKRINTIELGIEEFHSGSGELPQPNVTEHDELADRMFDDEYQQAFPQESFN